LIKEAFELKKNQNVN